MDEQTLAARERVLGPDHPDTLTSRYNLATGYRAAGRTEEAITLHEQTLAARERILGPDHPDTLNSRNTLAIAYRAAGRIEEAISLDEQTLAACERVLGPDHPDTLSSRNNLANGYRAAGRIEEAITLDEQTLAACERILGPDHPDTLTSRNNLAIGYRAAGRTERRSACTSRPWPPANASWARTTPTPCPRATTSPSPTRPRAVPRRPEMMIPDLLIRRNGRIVQDRPLRSLRWADIPQLSAWDAPCPAAWQQCWQQSRRPGADPDRLLSGRTYAQLPWIVGSVVRCR